MEAGSPDHLNGWVNGRLYAATDEVFGILPIPPQSRDALRFRPYDNTHPPKHHRYLAERQGTEHAVLPLATPAEKKLFNDLMRTHPKFMTASEPKWDECAAIWTEYCNGYDIFYKVRVSILNLHFNVPLTTALYSLAKTCARTIKPGSSIKMHQIP